MAGDAAGDWARQLDPGVASVERVDSGMVLLTLASDADSQKLEWMAAHGKDWRLEIRPPADATNSPRWHETSTTMLKDGAGQR